MVDLYPPHLQVVEELLSNAGLDPAILYTDPNSIEINSIGNNISRDSSKEVSLSPATSPPPRPQLHLKRTLLQQHSPPTNKRRKPQNNGHKKKTSPKTLISKCEVNSHPTTLRTLKAIASPILTVVDSTSASLALSKSSSRMAVLDQGVDSLLLQNMSIARNDYLRKARITRNLELELERRVLPTRTMGMIDDEDALRHFVDELDAFENKIEALRLRILDGAVEILKGYEEEEENRTDKEDDQLPLFGLREKQKIQPKSVQECLQTLKHCRWNNIDDDASSSSMEATSPSLYETLVLFRDAIYSLQTQAANANAAKDLLSSPSIDNSVITTLEKTRSHLYEIYDSSFEYEVEQVHTLLNDLENMLQKCSRSLDGESGSVLNKIENTIRAIPISVEDLDGPLGDWAALARKHGISPAKMLPQCQAALKDELDGTVDARLKLPLALQETQEARMLLDVQCEELLVARNSVARDLERKVTATLPQLGMEGVEFCVALSKRKNDDEYGCEFLLCPQSINGAIKSSNEINGNESINSSQNSNKSNYDYAVEMVASSGEKARILLAIETHLPGAVGASCQTTGTKSITTNSGNRNNPPESQKLATEAVKPLAVLYDEIDAHVGGRAAVAVAKLLSQQGKDCGQVISITHSPSVAAIADQHIVVTKQTTTTTMGFDTNKHHILSQNSGSGGRNSKGMPVTVASLKGEKRAMELARMAAGDLASVEASLFAEALLREGENQRLEL